MGHKIVKISGGSGDPGHPAPAEAVCKIKTKGAYRIIKTNQ